jgi:hypothetical protein
LSEKCRQGNKRASTAGIEGRNELVGVLRVHGRRRESDILAIDGHTVHGYSPRTELANGGGDDDRELRLRRDVAELGDDLGKRECAKRRVNELGEPAELVGEERLSRGVLCKQADERAVGPTV